MVFNFMKNYEADRENFIRRGSKGISQLVMGASSSLLTLNYGSEEVFRDHKTIGYVIPALFLLFGALIYFEGRRFANKLRDLRFSNYFDDKEARSKSIFN